MTNKVVLERVLADIAAAKVGDTTAHSSYVSGLFEDGKQEVEAESNEVLLRVLRDIQISSPGETTAHSSYVSGLFED
jgi:hypothetical protein